jgi:hypothetical protein
MTSATSPLALPLVGLRGVGDESPMRDQSQYRQAFIPDHPGKESSRAPSASARSPHPGQVGKFSFKSSITPGKQPPRGSALSRKTLLIGGQVTPDHSFVATLVCSSVSQEFTSVPF